MRIGIDLGGTNIAAGLVDDSNSIIGRAVCKTLPERGADAMVADMEALCYKAAAEAGVDFRDVRSVGIGSPGSVDPQKGVVVFSGNLHFRDTPLASLLEKRIGKPVLLGNDANVAALGEVIAGAGGGADSMIMITLGTGVGGGFVFDRRIFTGYNGCAAEVGHMVTHAGGRPCSCGRKGCWEAYASATGLVQSTKEAMEASPDSLLCAIAKERGKVSGRTAFLAAAQGDKAGAAVVAAYLREVAIGCANLINLLQPEIFCIGGGISGEGESLLDALRPLVEEDCFQVGDKRCELRLATLGNDAGIIGAACLE